MLLKPKPKDMLNKKQELTETTDSFAENGIKEPIIIQVCSLEKSSPIWMATWPVSPNTLCEELILISLPILVINH